LAAYTAFAIRHFREAGKDIEEEAPPKDVQTASRRATLSGGIT